MSLEERLRERLPAPVFSALRRAYNQRPSARRERKGFAERVRVANEVTARLGHTVLAGPFTGLVQPQATADSPAKIVGSYEAELHEPLERLIADEFSTILNVGCAEGYYAIGLAMRCPSANVRAYDIDPGAQEQTRAAAKINGVADRVRVLGECGAGDLQALDRSALVVMDCEGCEAHLLARPLRATVLVELHDFIDPTISDRIIGAVQNTHSVDLIETQPRSADGYPPLGFLAPADRALALFERPMMMRWAVIRPR